MKRTREEKRAELLQAAEAMIEELLDWEERTERPNLAQVENRVVQLRQQLGQRMAEVVIADQDAVQPAEAPVCPGCGERMRYKGQKRKTVESRLGTLTIARGYYHCSRCKKRLFPPQRAV
jgi:DNA-directed RNA polymerase subunit RPC12/RpoP